MKSPKLLLSPCALLLLAVSTAIGSEPAQGTFHFFESRIRPVLVDKCYRCHSEESGKSKGSLFVDTKAGLLKGGDSGTSIEPGNPEQSLLIEVIRRDDEDFAMPPKKSDALTPEQVEDFIKWIKMGAPDPRTGAKALTDFEKLMEDARDHWSFQPVDHPPVPDTGSDDQIQTEIDAFIQAKLKAEGMSASPKANKRELLRRAYFGLIGLPPTMEQVRTFEADQSADAFARVVDELLASPHYGERWGRHWLDVARYADTAGRQGNGRMKYNNAHTYRDYVIRAFNEDLPFNQFIIEQLAADHLNLPDGDNRSLAALGFLTVGRKMNGTIDDNARDDIIDTISRGFLGITVACARCHDHKLEPVSTQDYYSLYGIIRSSEEAATPPELRPQPTSPARDDFLQRNHEARTRYIRTIAFEAERIMTRAHGRVGDYLLAAQDGGFKNYYADEKNKQIVSNRSLHSIIFSSISAFWNMQVVGHPELFRPWLELTALGEEEFARKAPAMCRAYAANEDGSLNAAIAAGFDGLEPRSFQDIVWTYNRVFAQIDKLWGDRLRAELLRRCTPLDEELNLPKTTYGYEKPQDMAIDRLQATYQSDVIPTDHPHAALMTWLTGYRNGFAVSGEAFRKSRVLTRDVARGLRRDLKYDLDAVSSHPGAPSRAMAMIDASKMYESKVFIRGNANNLGADAPRRFLEILDGPERNSFPAETSGRLELAQKIADPKNPLTARVIVNRVWQWHFGEGLVQTTSDFGMQGSDPTHPALLDYLASWFMREGWSLKKLHRLILNSYTYQQSSFPVAKAAKLDPDNRLLHRMNPRKLEFEPFRDSILAVANRLDLQTRGGKPTDITAPGSQPRRTVYAEVDRKTLPNLFATFDFPDPMSTASRRNRNALTPESLFLLNSPFLTDSAKTIAHQTMPRSASKLTTSPGFTGRWKHDADPRRQTLIAVEHAGQRYPSIRGAERVKVIGSHTRFGSESGGLPLNDQQALAGCVVTNGLRDVRQADFMFHQPVTAESEQGLFVAQANGPGARSNAVTVRPLDEAGKPIGHWMLILGHDDFGSPLGKIQETQGHSTARVATFSRDDFVNLGDSETVGIRDRIIELEGYEQPNMIGERGYLSAAGKSQDDVKWVQVELTDSSSAPITRIELNPTFYYSKGSMFPLRYRVEIADDSEFKQNVRVVAGFEDEDAMNPGLMPVSIDVDRQSARYVRVTATRLASNLKLSLAEIRVFNADNTNLALGGVVISKDTTVGSGFADQLLTDGKFVREISDREREELDRLRKELAARIKQVAPAKLADIHGLRLIDDHGVIDLDPTATGTFEMKLPVDVHVDDDYRSFTHGHRLKADAVERIVGVNAFGTIGEAVQLMSRTHPVTLRISEGIYPERVDLSDRSNSIVIRVQGHVKVQSLSISNGTRVEGQQRLATSDQIGTDAFSDQVFHTGIQSLYRRIFQRGPTLQELDQAKRFLASFPPNDIVRPEVADWRYGHAKLADDKLTDFVPIQFAGGRIQGPSSLALTATGGRPGSNAAAVRRWIAPHSGTVRVTAELIHDPKTKTGDGVECVIVSDRAGILGRWTVCHEAKTTTLDRIQVQKGETLDFVTLGRQDDQNDEFEWAPAIVMIDKDIPSMKGVAMRWDAQRDFADPVSLPVPLTAWEELAQVLLMSNEFAYVD